MSATADQKRAYIKRILLIWLKQLEADNNAAKGLMSDLNSLVLSDFDREFLKSVGIQMPDESPWELDGDSVSDTTGKSETAE